jgi:DNA primase (bacterial type)
VARIPREIVEAVRERTDLVEVIGRHVSLQKRGGSHVGLCPFHQEKTPSFHVVSHKQFYHCFGCGASGDVFRFLQEIEGLGFVEAVRELAGPAGVEIREESLTAAERDRLRRRASLYDVLQEAAGLYHSTLLTRPEGATARAYLDDRG